MKNSFLRPALFVSAVLMYGCGNTPKPSPLSNENVVGQTCSVGDTKPAEDGCNTCTCDENGWACTEMGCVDPSTCTVGDTKPAEDGCNTCTCDGNSWACTEMACSDTASTTCTDGETKKADCNSCSCINGVWACTKMACIDTPSGQAGGECPAPQASAEMCAQVIVWSKSDDGKSCCQYATPCHAPKGWKQFASEAACSR